MTGPTKPAGAGNSDLPESSIQQTILVRCDLQSNYRFPTVNLFSKGRQTWKLSFYICSYGLPDNIFKIWPEKAWATLIVWGRDQDEGTIRQDNVGNSS